MADSITTDDITPAHIRALDHVMDFDHVVRVFPNGNVNPSLDVMAPECFVHVDSTGSLVPGADEELIALLGRQEWDLMRGYSGQDSYRGCVMHSSEFIGGRMARDILAGPGLYVALEVRAMGPDAEQAESPAGWAVAYRADD